MKNFSPKRPVEIEILDMDYRRSLARSETIISATWTMTVVEGEDPAPEDMLSGDPVIEGTRVFHDVKGGLAGVTYKPFCLAVTSMGQELLLPDVNGGGHLPIVDDY